MILIAFSLQTTHNISSMDYEWDFSLNTPSDSSSDSSSSSVKSVFEDCSTPVTMARVRKVSPPASNRDNEGGGIREKSVSPQASSTGMATRSVTSGTRRRSSAQLPVEASEKRRRVENAENASGGTVQALRVENPTRGAAGGRAEFADSPDEVSFWQDMTDGLLDSFDGVTDMGPEPERRHGVAPVAEPESVWNAKKPEEEDESVLNAKKPDEEDDFDGGDDGVNWDTLFDEVSADNERTTSLGEFECGVNSNPALHSFMVGDRMVQSKIVFCSSCRMRFLEEALETHQHEIHSTSIAEEADGDDE